MKRALILPIVGLLYLQFPAAKTQLTSDQQTQCVYNFLVPKGQDPSQPCSRATTDQLRQQLMSKVTSLQSRIHTALQRNAQLTRKLGVLMQEQDDVSAQLAQRLQQQRQINSTLSLWNQREQDLERQVNTFVDEHHLMLNQGPPDVYFTSPTVTYVRWGRTTCPGRRQKLYEGMAVGSYWNHAGGGKQFMCVSNSPQWLRYRDGFQKSRGQLYGTEYEEDEYFKPYGPGYSPIEKSQTGKSTLDNHDMPCVVCEGQGVRHVTVLPGLTVCPAGWQREYRGFLMAGGHIQKKTSNICVDSKPQIQANGYSNTVESTAYFIEITCGGTLRCPAKYGGRELTCIVCSKST